MVAEVGGALFDAFIEVVVEAKGADVAIAVDDALAAQALNQGLGEESKLADARFLLGATGSHNDAAFASGEHGIECLFGWWVDAQVNRQGNAEIIGALLGRSTFVRLSLRNGKLRR